MYSVFKRNGSHNCNCYWLFIGKKRDMHVSRTCRTEVIWTNMFYKLPERQRTTIPIANGSIVLIMVHMSIPRTHLKCTRYLMHRITFILGHTVQYIKDIFTNKKSGFNHRISSEYFINYSDYLWGMSSKFYLLICFND